MVMRPLRRALRLFADDYRVEGFSADGRHFAVSGNAYQNMIEVFAFPSLRRVLGVGLGEPYPGTNASPEWLTQTHSWGRHAAVFGPVPGVLWIGTPAGRLIACDIPGQRLTEHGPPGVSGVSALAVTPAGELVVAGTAGELSLVTVASAPTPGDLRAPVDEFLATTAESAGTEPPDDEETDDDADDDADDDGIDTRFALVDNTDAPWLQIAADGNPPWPVPN